MPELAVHNQAGEAVDRVTLDDRIFGAEVRADLVHAAVVAQLAARRLGTHKALTRGEVTGGGRKPYRQKGTGRARHGSIVSPIFKGGGVIFAPTPRDYSHRMPRKMRRAALFAAWSDHAAGGSLVVADSLALDEPRTRLAAERIEALLGALAQQAADAAEGRPEETDGRPSRRVKVRRHVLVMLGPDEAELQRAFRNLDTLSFDFDEKVTVNFIVHLATAPYASVYHLTLADAVVASRSALARVEQEFAVRDAEEQSA